MTSTATYDPELADPSSNTYKNAASTFKQTVSIRNYRVIEQGMKNTCLYICHMGTIALYATQAPLDAFEM